ncbi:Fibroblast Growth Factor 9 [Manis pentadactyla]|nr:Fibroblast Growth Factor 9 [Manis pentadactyla]
MGLPPLGFEGAWDWVLEKGKSGFRCLPRIFRGFVKNWKHQHRTQQLSPLDDGRQFAGGQNRDGMPSGEVRRGKRRPFTVENEYLSNIRNSNP